MGYGVGGGCIQECTRGPELVITDSHIKHMRFNRKNPMNIIKPMNSSMMRQCMDDVTSGKTKNKFKPRGKSQGKTTKLYK